MIKIAFLLNFTVEYKGGINYFKNLFFALSKYRKDTVAITLFIPDDLPKEYDQLFSPYVDKVVKTSIIRRKSIPWYLSKIMERVIGYDFLTYFLMKKHNIRCISHSNYVSPRKDVRVINWIPDFQYVYYPNLWSKADLEYVKGQHQKWVNKSDSIVVSSHAAKKDFLKEFPSQSDKVNVLHFVSQPHIKTITSELDQSSELDTKYFYLPNQFWIHKNHIVVFKAIKLLKDKGIEVTLITTGSGVDYRDSGQHWKMLNDYVTENDLENNIKFYGLVPYEKVFSLMRNSIAIINPSLFEGWSSTVEESKSMNKAIILSNIEVHQEQRPLKAVYFNPNDESELATILMNFISGDVSFGTISKDEDDTLDKQTKSFADNYVEIVQKMFN